MDISPPSRYQPIAELGRGGMGRVLKAHDTALNRIVAIKLVKADSDPEIVERLKREALAIAKLSHPNIVTIFDVIEMDGDVGIVMEYVAGVTLEQRMRQESPTERVNLLPRLSPCADALDYAHRRGVIHRDIKPSNIMLGEDGLAKVLDFGIAKVASSRERSATQTGAFLGTPGYISPEQLTGGRIGPRTDQYSFAVLLYELLAGREPFQATEIDIYGQIHQIVTQPAPPPSTFNPALSRRTDQALLKALSKNPEDRFVSCREMFDGVAAALTKPVARSSGGILTARWTLKDILDTFVGNVLGTRWRNKGDVDGATVAEPPVLAPKLPAEQATQSAPPPSRTVIAPEALQQFSQGEPAPAAPPPAVPASSGHPGEFTQMLQNPERPASPPSPTPPSSQPGEFTRMFRRGQTEHLRLPSLNRIDPESLAKAQGRELVEILDRRDFESAVGLRGKWLPGIEGASGELLSFSEAARYLGAAQDAVSPHIRIEHLKRAEKVLFSAGNQLLADTSPASRHLPEALDAWKGYTRELLSAAQLKAARELPNPFRAGQPLRPDQGRAVFRGRNNLVRSIEAILADADQNSSLALLGPRRCGKTSALQMLPAMLPDCACVFFDLQDNAASTVAGFFDALVRRARQQLREQRRLEIPELEGDKSFESAAQWLDQLDTLPGVNRILISIDEFERLESLFPGDRRDLLRLMGMFRATIQHRRKVRLLVSGVDPFEELGPLWNDHFINVRELRIGHLDEDTSIALLIRPIPEFPQDAVPEDVARLIFRRTAGQPYLLQLFGTLLVNRLNEEERATARLEDVSAIEAEAITQGRYYFDNTYRDVPEAQREVLEALARGEYPTITGAVRRWMERRCLISEDNTLRTPVLGVFIREELGIDKPT